MSLTALVSCEVSRGSAKAVNMGRTKKEDIPVLILNLQPFFILQPVAFSLPLPNCRSPPKAVTAFSRYLMYACPVDSPSSSSSFGFDFDVAATACLAFVQPSMETKTYYDCATPPHIPYSLLSFPSPISLRLRWLSTWGSISPVPSFQGL